MILKDYVARLLEIMNKNPKNEDLQVVYASDAEGNSFCKVIFAPSLGFYCDQEFHTLEYLKQHDEQDDINAICIN